MEVAKIAAERVDDGVVAFGIGGDEPAVRRSGLARCSPSRASKACGSRLTPGRLAVRSPSGSDRDRGGAHRPWNSSIEDPVLIRELRNRAIPLEVCISSNVATGAVASLDAQPDPPPLRCGRSPDNQLGRSGMSTRVSPVSTTPGLFRIFG